MTQPNADKPSVLYVCIHNAGRSQMAAAYTRHLSGGAVEVLSAGSEPADQVNPSAVAAMAEDGIDITADGTAELALSGGDFFRAIWINEIVIEEIEIRPMGVHSIEFDKAGTAQVSFIAIVPGTYTLSIPGSDSDSGPTSTRGPVATNGSRTAKTRNGTSIHIRRAR